MPRTLPGTTGRLLSVTIMICGVTLFLRLAQALFRPSKVTFECPTCALSRHEPDAVHCKACGNLLRIRANYISGTAVSGVTLEFRPSMLIANVRSDQSSIRFESATSSAACPAE